MFTRLKHNSERTLAVALLFVIAACNSDDKTEQHKVGSNPSSISIESTATFANLRLSKEAFDYYNSHSINNTEPTALLKTLCKNEIYSFLKDDFDFIIVVMNNTVVPTAMPFGEYQAVKNDIQGIGLPLFDYTAQYGSAGKLQGVYFLYKNNLDLGPVLHEMFHRWGNYVVKQNYSTHWDSVQGILSSVTNKVADIELYLAGAIPASQIKDAASLNIYNDPLYVGSKTRIPDSSTAQKHFKSLVLVLSQEQLSTAEIKTYKDAIANITRTPSQGATNPAYQNIYNKTNGLMSLSVGELDKSIK